jgi:hypothetical protein
MYNLDQWGSPIPLPTGGACVLSVIRFQDGGRRSAGGSVPKLEYDILRRNAVSESCHESTFKLIRHHNFNDVLFSVGATWTFNKYNNIEK